MPRGHVTILIPTPVYIQFRRGMGVTDKTDVEAEIAKMLTIATRDRRVKANTRQTQ